MLSKLTGAIAPIATVLMRPLFRNSKDKTNNPSKYSFNKHHNGFCYTAST